MENNELHRAGTRPKIKEGFVGQRMIVLPPDIKREVAKNEFTRRFYLTAIGYYPRAVFHDRERKSGSAQYILLYCVEGNGHVNLRGKSTQLQPNTCIIIPKDVPHHYKSSVTNPWSIYWVHFIGEGADLLYNRYQQQYGGAFAIPHDERRISAFDLIFNLLQNNFNTRNLEIVNIKLLDFIASFIYFAEINPATAEKDAVDHSIAFMKQHINGLFTLTQLAQQQRLSVSHYSRLFLAKTGVSPGRYFNQLKVQQSCQLLYFSDRSIKEICTELGFDDPFYFSRLFKKLMGVSPANYKTQHRKN
jgi:AraC-like DNA-binding protein/quercetin dioxygenase-like cupin family protein